MTAFSQAEAEEHSVVPGMTLCNFKGEDVDMDAGTASKIQQWISRFAKDAEINEAKDAGTASKIQQKFLDLRRKEINEAKRPLIVRFLRRVDKELAREAMENINQQEEKYCLNEKPWFKFR